MFSWVDSNDGLESSESDGPEGTTHPEHGRGRGHDNDRDAGGKQQIDAISDFIMRTFFEQQLTLKMPHQYADGKKGKELTFGLGGSAELSVGPFSGAASLSLYVSMATDSDSGKPDWRVGVAASLPDFPKVAADLSKGQIRSWGVDATVATQASLNFGDFENGYLGRSDALVASGGPVTVSRQLSEKDFGVAVSFGPGVGGKVGIESNVTRSVLEFNAYDANEAARRLENGIRNVYW